MRLVLAFCLGLMLFTSLAAADANLSGIFTGNDSIIPPGVLDDQPDGSSRSIGAPEADFIAAESAPKLMAAAATAAWEGGPKTLGLLIKDVSTGELITNAHIRVFMDNGDEKSGTLRFVGDDGKMDLQLDRGQWAITMMLDITSTTGKDYYAEMDVPLNADTNMTVFLQPVGSLSGEVLDSSSNLLPGAAIKFECAGDYGLGTSSTTDEFGAFSAEWLPVGSCKISALYGSKAGSATVQIARGQLSEIQILLEQSIAKAQQDYTWLIAVAVAVVAALFLFHARMRKKPAVNEAPSPVKLDSRMEGMLSALDDVERRIVERLIENGGQSQQNKLGRELGLPKSSLSRAIGGLEARHLINTEKLGRVKRIELSPWFLNGKKPF